DSELLQTQKICFLSILIDRKASRTIGYHIVVDQAWYISVLPRSSPSAEYFDRIIVKTLVQQGTSSAVHDFVAPGKGEAHRCIKGFIAQRIVETAIPGWQGRPQHLIVSHRDGARNPTVEVGPVALSRSHRSTVLYALPILIDKYALAIFGIHAIR